MLHTLSLPCAQGISGRRGEEEQEYSAVSTGSAKCTTRGFAWAYTAFPVFVQHMPAEDGGHAYNEFDMVSNRNDRSKAF